MFLAIEFKMTRMINSHGENIENAIKRRKTLHRHIVNHKCDNVKQRKGSMKSF